MSAPKKVRIIQATVVERVLPGTQEKRSQMIAVDSQGRLWERFSDMPPGEWGLVETPNEPPPQKRIEKK